MTTTGEVDHVLHADPADPGNIKAWLHRDHRASGKLGNGKAGGLMNFEAEAVSHTVEKSGPAPAPDLGGITTVPKPVAEFVLGFLAVESRSKLSKNPFLALGDRGVYLLKSLRRPAFDHRAGDVSEITGAGIAGKDIENNGLMGAERTGTSFMGVTGLDAAGHNGVFGEGTGPEAGGFHLDAEALRSEDSPAPTEDLFRPNLGAAQDLDATIQAGFGGAKGLGEMAEFEGLFAQAFGKEGIGNGPEPDAGTPELLKQADRERGGNFGGADAMVPENGREDARVRGLGEAEALFFFLKVETGVGGGGAAGPVDFEGAKENEGLTARRAEPGKVVGDEETGCVGKVGNAVGVAEEETGGPGHDQEDFRRAPARKPARRKPSRTRGRRRSRPNR
jgi:hypothetical protein